MSQLKVNTIRHTGATSDAVTLATDGTCTAKITNNLSNRNLMINGAMNVAQRGTSDTSDGQGYTTVDRWYISWAGLEEELQRHQEQLTSSDTGPWEKGFRNAWKVTNGNQTGGQDANGLINAQYAIEAQDLATCGWDHKDPNSKITLSFWVKSSVAQTFYGYLATSDGTVQGYSFSYALSANTWTKVTKTIPGNSNITIDNNNGEGLRIYLPLFVGTDKSDSGNTEDTWAAYSGSSRTKDWTTSASSWYNTNNATWHLTGIQLEVGDYATEFEHRSFGDELARCHRYYYRLKNDSGSADGHWYGVGQCDSTTQLRGAVTLPHMRVAPDVFDDTETASDYKVWTTGNTTTTCSARPGVNSLSTSACRLTFTVSSGLTGGQAGCFRSGSTDSYLGWGAEL